MRVSGQMREKVQTLVTFLAVLAWASLLFLLIHIHTAVMDTMIPALLEMQKGGVGGVVYSSLEPQL